METRPFFIIMVLLAASTLAFALSADDVARFYLKSGESLKLESIVAGGKAFSLVKIDGEPSIVLAPSGNTFEPLTTKEALDPVLEAYAQQIYKAKDFNKSAALISEAAPNITAVLGDCDIGAQTFIKSLPSRTIRIGKANLGLFYLISRSSNSTYKAEWDAIQLVNNSFPAYHAAYADYTEKSGQFATNVVAGNVDAVLEAVPAISNSVSTLKKEYTALTSAYASLKASKELSAILLYTFYEAGNAHTCAFNGNATTLLSKVENEFTDRSLKSKAQMLELVLSRTGERQQTAAKDTAHAARSENHAKIVANLNNVTAKFTASGYTVDFKSLNAKKEAMTKALEAIKAGGDVKAYDSVYAEVNEALPKYSDTLAPFQDAAEAVKKASENVSSAQRKYGDADKRVMELKQEYAGLASNFTSHVNLLGSGSIPEASAKFAEAKAQAIDMAKRAGELQAKGNELDITVIAGVVLLLLALGATLFYFKKMKQSQPKMGTE